MTDLWGIAGRLAARLALVGIDTPLALKGADPRFVRERLSVVVERMVHELRGDSCLHLEEHAPDPKSIMASRSFGRPVTNANEMREAVASHATRAAEKLRQQRLVTASLMVFVETNRFRPDERQHCATQAVRLPGELGHGAADPRRPGGPRRAVASRISLRGGQRDAARAACGRYRAGRPVR